MAGQVFDNPKVSVNGTDLSGDADKATDESSLESVDITPFGANNRVVIPSLGDGKITVEFFSDWRASGPNVTLLAMHQNSKNGIAGTIELIPDKDASVSATNRRITMVAHLMNFSGLVAGVGDASKYTAEFTNAGTAGITYGTS